MFQSNNLLATSCTIRWTLSQNNRHSGRHALDLFRACEYYKLSKFAKPQKPIRNALSSSVMVICLPHILRLDWSLEMRHHWKSMYRYPLTQLKAASQDCFQRNSLGDGKQLMPWLCLNLEQWVVKVLETGYVAWMRYWCWCLVYCFFFFLEGKRVPFIYNCVEDYIVISRSYDTSLIVHCIILAPRVRHT